MVKLLECSTVVQNIEGSNLAEVNDWKALTVHPAVNGFLNMSPRQKGSGGGVGEGKFFKPILSEPA